MNPYLKNLEKIEFVLTDRCTGRCKHCSQGDHRGGGAVLDAELCCDAVQKIAERYHIRTLLVFGGEPLLYPESVFRIISAAREANIRKRQVITNGFFTRDKQRIKSVAKGLFDAGVNDLLVSVDAFHQDSIPLSCVFEFVGAAVSFGIPTRLQPAWLGGADIDNPYNRRTREILDFFSVLKVAIGEGNVVFPEGNAKKYLAEYFENETVINPYSQDPCNVKCVSFSANGDVLYGNVYKNDILQLLMQYDPQEVI